MSATTPVPDSTATTIPPFVVPILHAFGDSVRPLVIICVETAICVGVLLPLLACVLYLPSRRGLMWYLIVGEICYGLAIGAWGLHETTKVLFDPVSALATGSAGYQYALSLSPWVVDIVLFARLVAVYPYRSWARLRFVSIIAFPVVVKGIRLACVIVQELEFVHTSNGLQTSAAAAASRQGWSNWATAEWTLQLADNGYASALFMWKLRSGFQSAEVGRFSDGGRDSFGARLRMLFWIAATNFVFPVLLNIVQLVVRFTSDFYTAAYVLVINIYVSIVGVTFALLWSSSDGLRAFQSTAPAGAASTQLGGPAIVFRRDIQTSSGPWNEDTEDQQLSEIAAVRKSKSFSTSRRGGQAEEVLAIR